jgi:hypothetical protein
MAGDKQVISRAGKPHRWRKGESGNPAGRKPKADCLISCIKSELAKHPYDGKATNEQLIASALVGMAAKGNLKAIEILMSFTTPKPAQGINLGGEGGVAIRVFYELASPKTNQEDIKTPRLGT